MKNSANRTQPIGVFDSGVGGLTVVKALRRVLPEEDVVYFGDTARVPYGTKSREAIIRFSRENTRILLKHRVKLVVVACNSSSGHALPTLRRAFKVPVIGVIIPGAARAAAVTRKNIVGVIATPATVHSGAYPRAVKKEKSRVRVVSAACPLFVPLAEEGWLDREVTRRVAEEYLRPVRKAGADTLILGCTHYPLLKKVIQRAVGPRVTLIDSAEEVARAARRRLQDEDLIRSGRRRGTCRFLVSDEPRHFQAQARRFLGAAVRSVRRVGVGS